MAAVQTAPHMNGNGYANNLANGLINAEKAEKKTVQSLSKEHDMVLKTFRVLIADLCGQFNGGHPG